MGPDLCQGNSNEISDSGDALATWFEGNFIGSSHLVFALRGPKVLLDYEAQNGSMHPEDDEKNYLTPSVEESIIVGEVSMIEGADPVDEEDEDPLQYSTESRYKPEFSTHFRDVLTFTRYLTSNRFIKRLQDCDRRTNANSQDVPYPFWFDEREIFIYDEGKK